MKTNEARALARDISRWQFPWDPGVSADGGAGLVAMRSTISWGYRDPHFAAYWEAAAERFAGRRTSYHVIYPDQAVSRQLDNWYAAHPEIDVIPRVIDLELDRGMHPASIGAATQVMTEVVAERDGVRPIIYTRYRLANEWLRNWEDEFLRGQFFWLAQYLTDRATEHPGPPTLPDRVLADRALLHQTADKKPGFPGEVGSPTVDWDRWCHVDPDTGGISDMGEFIAREWGGGDPGPTLEEKVDILWDLHDLSAEHRDVVHDDWNGRLP